MVFISHTVAVARRHHLAPRVAFNDFPVKDVSVMLLLFFLFFFSLCSRPAELRMKNGAAAPQLYFDKNVNVM